MNTRYLFIVLTKKNPFKALREKNILYFCHRKLTNTNKKIVKLLRYRHSVVIEGIFLFSYFLII